MVIAWKDLSSKAILKHDMHFGAHQSDLRAATLIVPCSWHFLPCLGFWIVSAVAMGSEWGTTGKTCSQAECRSMINALDSGRHGWVRRSKDHVCAFSYVIGTASDSQYHLENI